MFICDFLARSISISDWVCSSSSSPSRAAILASSLLFSSRARAPLDPELLSSSASSSLSASAVLLVEVLGLLKHLILAGVCLLGVPLDLFHGLLKLFQLLDGVFLQLVVHIHGRLQVLVVCLKFLFCIDSSLLLLAFLIQLTLEVTELFGHSPPFLLSCLLLSGEVPLELCLEGLHVDLEPHLLVLGLLKFILELLKLGLLLVELLLQLPLSLLQLVDILVRSSLGVY